MWVADDGAWAALANASAGHVDPELSAAVLASLGQKFANDRAPPQDVIGVLATAALARSDSGYVHITCITAELRGDQLAVWSLGSRYGIHWSGEWLLCEPREMRRPILRGYQALAAHKPDRIHPCPVYTARMPAAQAVGLLVTDAASFHREEFEALAATPPASIEHVRALLEAIPGRAEAGMIAVVK